jgi:hypothetical protein
VAFGTTAPVASVTVPVIPAVDCANALCMNRKQIARAKTKTKLFLEPDPNILSSLWVEKRFPRTGWYVDSSMKYSFFPCKIAEWTLRHGPAARP